jgi:hypothetical protein
MTDQNYFSIIIIRFQKSQMIIICLTIMMDGIIIIQGRQRYALGASADWRGSSFPETAVIQYYSHFKPFQIKTI